MLSSIQEPTIEFTHATLLKIWSPIFDQFQDIVLILNCDGMIIRSNEAWQQFSVMQTSNKILQSFRQWIHPENVLEFQNTLFSLTIKKISLRLLNSEQKSYWFELQLQPIFDSEIKKNCIGWCILGTEFTEKIHSHDQLSAQMRSLNDLLSRLPVMLYRSRNDWHWTMEYVSHGCRQLTGYGGQDLLNTPLYGQLIHIDDQQYVWENIQYALEQHTVFHLEYRLYNREQKIQYVQDIGHGLYSSSDMILGVEGAVFFQS